MALAKTIGETVLEELNYFAVSGSKPDPFTIARLRREISKLEKVEPIGALLCQGILFSIENNAEEAIRAFEEILSYDPNNPDMNQNYGHSLAKLKMANSAQKHYIIAADHSLESTSALIDVAETAQVVFRPTDFTEALERNAHKADVEKLMQNADVQNCFTVAELFKEFGIDEADANKIGLSAERICVQRDLSVMNGYFRRTGMYGSSKLTFYAGIEGDSDTICDMNIDLSDSIIDNDAGHILAEISYIFVPYHAGDAAILIAGAPTMHKDNANASQ
ncbi:tetratricopeptide repeat protein [Pseudomonas sp. B21-053]|uniref:tetratricopeptide repeat protein n=1 Tax=Pseudomonas sp. B21-053 TaxID=2895493 RepID=UPI0022322E59|nr:hypothetical protein [Pseudomonas sp. B21-053]UZE12807.1 hypothetical protein LOY68_04135 [Pseudomonas sp. B21-053]